MDFAALVPLLTGFVTYSLAIGRMVRYRSTAGTSATSLALSAVSCVQWSLWAAWHHFPLMMWVNIAYLVILIIPEFVTMALVRPLRWRSWWLVPAWVTLNVVCALVWVSGGPDLLGVAVSASGLVWLLPALREIFTMGDLAGVSLWSWVVTGVSTVGWGMYGLATGAWTAAFYSWIVLAGVAAAVARIATMRLRERHR